MSAQMMTSAPLTLRRPLSGRPAPTSPDRTPMVLPLDSDALLRGCREVLIRHGGETYRLRHTRNDKLILTK
ncbi:Hemin uptake protein HemP [Lysobacter spongiicola DSM 21749]|uniref:Hemin uptake protein HemP n=2 Tax=Novilysobacter TaxID=3382699 RepID=A0A1T4RE28_9GAMM|nr:Hemin uptake protein HemP [Lysobacter spongiicola DSM 21749]